MLEMNVVTIWLMTRRVILYPGEDGFIVAEVPSLPGCISQGKTRDEALANVREAIGLHEEVLRDRGDPASGGFTRNGKMWFNGV